MMSLCGSQPGASGGKDTPTTAQFEKTQQAPILDALGPYPDEAIMTILDRILYYAGATKIQHKLEMAALAKSVSEDVEVKAAASETSSARTSHTSFCTMLGGNTPKTRSCVSSKASSSASSCCRTVVTPSTCCNSKPACLKHSSNSRIAAAASCPRQRTPRVDFANPVEEIRANAGGSKMSARIKSSLSLCSLACQRLKSKISGVSCSSGGNNPKWLWTRLVNSKDGCKVYEVYKDSNVNRNPCELAGSQHPVIVFLVMPNGYILPFESLSC